MEPTLSPTQAQTVQLTELVSRLLETLGVVVEKIEVSVGHRTMVLVESSDHALLIGEDGDHLRALNTLARRISERAHGEEISNFHIDVNRYHESQLDSLRDTARQLAQRARLFKHEVEMPAMSAYERLVIHELFADDAQIKTESRGEGKFRHVVLSYQD